jgi:Putative zinc-finger
MRPERDDPLADEIRRTLQASRTDCPDAGTIAAYAERALPSVERRGVEEHLSNCSRCRETLLLMEKGTATVLQKTEKGGSPLYRWPWLAAAAAAGLATVIWLKLPPSAVRESESNQVAQVLRQEKKEQPQGLPEQAAANKVPVEADAAARKTVPATPRSRQKAAEPPGAVPPAAREEFGERAKPTDERRDQQKLGEAAGRRATAEHRVAVPEAPPPPAAAPAPAPQRESIATDAAAPSLMARQNREYLIASGPRLRSRVADAAPTITWRVWASGVVERSSDLGATWTREAGVDALGARAVVSPTADVCWIVGDAGLILRFETGRGWTRIAPPAPVGFIAIEASNARNATITAADGRRFTTTDGGQSWK